MRYVNARDVLPAQLLALISEHIDGAYLYIPRKEEHRKAWGANTAAKALTRARNQEIYAKYQNGETAAALADAYFLSDKSIQRIITLGNKQQLNN